MKFGSWVNGYKHLQYAWFVITIILILLEIVIDIAKCIFF